MPRQQTSPSGEILLAEEAEKGGISMAYDTKEIEFGLRLEKLACTFPILEQYEILGNVRRLLRSPNLVTIAMKWGFVLEIDGNITFGTAEIKMSEHAQDIRLKDLSDFEKEEMQTEMKKLVDDGLLRKISEQAWQVKKPNPD